MKTRSYAKRTL